MRLRLINDDDNDDDDPSLRQAQGKLDSGQARLPAWKKGDEIIRRRGIAIDYSHHHHSVFNWNGQMVENHYDIENRYASRKGRQVDDLLKRLSQVGRKEVAVGDGKVFLPSADFNSIFLISHSASHFAGDHITLRHLLDWALFVSEDACRSVINELIQTDAATFGKYGIVDGDSTVVYKGSITSCVTVWETLKEDIKNHHRFTTDLDRLKAAGWETLLDNQWPLGPADSFYRARIHYKKTDSFGVDDMGAPERGDCPAGRANPEGIPYLYLTEEPKTTFYETRVNMHDVVSVGEFKIVGNDPLLVENLTDIDLNEIDDLLDEDVVTLAKRKLLIQALSKDMSNPMRRFDSKIEYVPTQFICEYVSFSLS